VTQRSVRAAVVAALALGAGLVAGGQSTPAPAFERHVAPFEVLDEAGKAFALPFLGGLDVPRPQFVDIDGDADVDLFLQEYSNQLRFFENTGGRGAPRFVWRSDRYQNLEIGEWFRFVDLDADGDPDLLSEQPFSHIRLYRNHGNKSAPQFGTAETLLDSDGQPMFLDRQNIPAIVDLDCDGRLDLFIGRVEGTVTRYEAEAPASIRFALIAERFENIEIVGRGAGPSSPPPPLAGSGPSSGETSLARPTLRHGANALAFADFDGDKDADFFWGDFFEAGMLLIQNIGPTCSTPSFQVEPVSLPYAGSTATSGYNVPAPVDLDGDGDLDFLMGVIGGSFNPVSTAADNFYHWERTAADRLELRTSRFLNGIDLGSDTAPAFVDFDGDGDLDIAVGTKVDPADGDAGRLFLFENIGTRTAPRYRQQAAMKILDAYHLAPAFADLDGDGDYDLVLGTWNHDVRYFRNDGTSRAPKWVEREELAIRPPRVSMATPALADIDGDKDLDLLIGQATGAITLYRNDGTVKAPRFTLASERLDDIRTDRRSAPALIDLTGDGLLDLVLGRETGGVAVYRNAGSRTAAKFVAAPELLPGLALPPASTPAFADLDGDGVVELVSGSISGGLVFLKR
jgi:hypothetical protein